MSLPRMLRFAPFLVGLAVLAAGCGRERRVVAPIPAPAGLREASPGVLTPVGLPAINASRRIVSLQNSWPNDDQHKWLFRLAQRTWSSRGPQTWPSPEQVPAVTLDHAQSLLGTLPAGDSPRADSARYELGFDGFITTQSGVTAQNLREFIISLHRLGAHREATDGGRAFLAELARARPSLRARIAALAPSAVDGGPGFWIWSPILIHGYAWRKTTTWIGTFGDVDQLLAWKFLQAEPRPGSEFSHQLVPSLASDVWLRARVLRGLELTLPSGARASAVEVLYLIDYGVETFTDQNGNLAGYGRAYDFGTVVYAAGVGPVRCYERRLVWLGDPQDVGFGDLELDLIATTPGRSGRFLPPGRP